MAINEHPPPREELSTTEDEDDGAVEYHDELLRTDDGEITRAAKKQAISAKLPTASVAPPLGPPLPHTSSTPVKITPSTSPSDIIVGEKDKARLVGKILQGQQSGVMRNHSERQMVIRDLGLIIVWLDSQDSDLMVESAIGIRALPTISQLAFPRSPMLQKTFDTLFSEEAEAMDLLQQVLSHRYLEARRLPKSRGEYDLQLLFNMSDYDF
ncbi:hypothetical protein PSHT_14450 [Puccinia striiformis]|uniref:Uncharacterized protein n=1 Tax=Puccinia striiformis TaxID=27350 RepID=A0A2S4UKN7_9BASI|nr:hypothetical protein PSHT_14450 [Puccinia striiformis]